MTKRNNLSSILAISLMVSTSAIAAEIETNAALMQAMDKVTGRVNKITVPVNSKVTFGDFSLVLRSCKKRPAEETPENFAFIDVTDKSFGKDEYNIFRGWVLSSTPGISAIEHPIYDVWLLECIDAKNDEAKLLSEEELAQRDELPTKKIMQETENVSELAENEKVEATEPQAIHIKEFIQEDRDIEKDITSAPTYISEETTSYVSDIEEGEEPENLLMFTKMQEVSVEKVAVPVLEKQDNTKTDDLSQAIDAEIKALNKD